MRRPNHLARAAGAYTALDCTQQTQIQALLLSLLPSLLRAARRIVLTLYMHDRFTLWTRVEACACTVVAGSAFAETGWSVRSARGRDERALDEFRRVSTISTTFDQRFTGHRAQQMQPSSCGGDAKYL